MTSTSKSIPDCPDRSLDVPDVLICGTCVQMGWCLKTAKAFKLFVAMVIRYDKTSIFLFVLHLIKPQYGFRFSSAVACLD